ncbi:MAG TPA: hypothetical protein VJ965_10290 [Anaerolineales bacterium]|nr:hypothetical protein [Anaerolineales bacterium]
MKKLMISVFVFTLLLTACAAGVEQTTPTPLPDTIPWEDAMALLQTGEVEQVVQLHSLKVTLYLKDGQQVDTIEPGIDAIFDEIQQCGAPCSNIILATE